MTATSDPTYRKDPMSENHLPLTGLRVVDLTDGVAGMAPRFLADLGADVILVEPPEGLADRTAEPLHEGHALSFAITHANKRGVALDLTTPDGREVLFRITDTADIVIESRPIGSLSDVGVGQDVLRARNPRLIVVSISEFGQTGPYRDHRGGELVTNALTSVLTRSGAPGREPLLPPGDLARQTAAISAAYTALLAYYHAQHTGTGDYIDCSLYDLAVQDLDPGLGMAGSATMGRSQLEMPPGRPDVRMMYPILPCADGFVRTFIGAPKQWDALFEWMGKPAEFADPSYREIFTRFMNWSKIRPAVEELFADKTRADIVDYGSQKGIAVASLLTVGEVLETDHVKERRSFVDAEIAPGLTAPIANGFVEIDGVRAGHRHRAPALDEHRGATWHVTQQTPAAAVGDAPARPLEGIRVLDLGVIVVGGETGRSLADMGADVIKVENRAFKDGSRQADSPDKCSSVFAAGNRNKRSVGLNLRDEAGKDIFTKLVAASDVVLTNFKPGTLEGLGLGYDALREINPRIVLVESSALGSTGPWSKQMGYGPLVRATVGLTSLWRHPDADDAFGDDMTIFPDHSAARVGVTAVVAALIERERSGRGRKINLAQMETVFSQLATTYTLESLVPGSATARGNRDEFHAPSGIYECEGEDAYCAISVTDDLGWKALAVAIGREDLVEEPSFATNTDRLGRRDELDAIIGEWTATRTAGEVHAVLQAAGVAAGAAYHVGDLLTDPHLAARHQVGSMAQPGYDAPVPVHAGPALFENIPEPALRPAPFMAEHTREVLAEVLGLSASEIDELVEAGIAETRMEAAGSAP
ncbi:CaiB/BaiF CoA transferase family protein [Gordonia terrae]